MLFAVICKDKPVEGAALRQQIRPRHVAYLEGLGGALKFAGPLLDEAGAAPVGSLIIIAAGNLKEAREMAAGDPFAQAGVFASAEVLPWRQTLGPAIAD